jgi:protein TonB
MRVFVAFVMMAALSIGSVGSSVVRGQAGQVRTVQLQPELTVLLDLARMYVEQGRLDDADRTLRLAVTALARLRAAGGETGVTVAQGQVLRVGGHILEPRKVRHVPPVYPEVARAARVQGVVIAEVVLDEAGAVADVRILRSVPLLDQAAVDAVRQWRYTPTRLNGQPVRVVMTATVNFQIDR